MLKLPFVHFCICCHINVNTFSWPLTQFNRRRPRASDRFARIQIYERLYLYLSLLHCIPKKTQDICAISGFMRLSYYIRTGETNVCETYSILYTLQNIYDPYIIEENENFFYWFSISTYTVSLLLLLGAGYPTLTPVEGEVRFFHALGPAGPFAKRHEQQYFQHTEKHHNDITARQKHSNCTSFCSSP